MVSSFFPAHFGVDCMVEWTRLSYVFDCADCARDRSLALSCGHDVDNV
jgi:hypothetical protein